MQAHGSLLQSRGSHFIAYPAAHNLTSPAVSKLRQSPFWMSIDSSDDAKRDLWHRNHMDLPGLNRRE